jgi:hypothetical protein
MSGILLMIRGWPTLRVSKGGGFRISVLKVACESSNAIRASLLMRVWARSQCLGGSHPGEEQNRPFQLSFNASLRVDFQGSRITSDGGLILIRELDERLGFGELIEQYLTDSRAGNARLPFADLLRHRSIVGWPVTGTSTTPRGVQSDGNKNQFSLVLQNVASSKLS